MAMAAALVGSVERFGNLPADIELVGQGYRAPLEALGKRLAFHELEARSPARRGIARVRKWRRCSVD
jgi:hypothetical protein